MFGTDNFDRLVKQGLDRGLHGWHPDDLLFMYNEGQVDADYVLDIVDKGR
jgi:hypothetical protein